MKKMIAMILCLVLAVMSFAVAEEATEVTTVILGKTVELAVEEAKAENAETVWTSSDETVVTVDENGVVTALNAGEAVITAAVTTTTKAPEATDETAAPAEDKVETVEIAFNVAVEAAVCPGCGAEYTSAGEFTAHVQIAVCGEEGHYVCDGQDHETILDEFCPNEENPHRVCMAGVATHECASCGETYACEDSGSHTTCIACGNAWCYKDEGDHFTPKCGKIEHRPCMLDGKFNTSEHRRCRHCNALRCNGVKHGVGKCVPAPVVDMPQ